MQGDPYSLHYTMARRTQPLHAVFLSCSLSGLLLFFWDSQHYAVFPRLMLVIGEENNELHVERLGVSQRLFSCAILI